MNGYLFYNRYYSYLLGLRISGTMGRCQGLTRTINGKTYYGMKSRRFPKITYYVWNGTQYKRRWVKPADTITPRRLQERDAMRQGVLGWKALSNAEKDNYRALENGKNIKSGYNYYLSNYIKNFLKEKIKTGFVDQYFVDESYVDPQ